MLWDFLRRYRFFIFIGIVVVFLSVFVYDTIRIISLNKKIEYLQNDFESTKLVLSQHTNALYSGVDRLEEETFGLSTTLSLAEQNIATTKENVENVQSKVGGVEQTVGQISGTVTTLEKLSKTDPELLQKYSKIFFLNEHYVPERVSEIKKENLYNESRAEQVHASVLPYLQSLFDVAEKDNETIYVRSAYRSFDTQEAIKNLYTVVYGAGTANQFSADQGYSEHQLGTTVDFITTGLGGKLDGFEKTNAYRWLLGNAHKYGFALSYPENNLYYIFEPWHWRFVGIKLATDLYNGSKFFYDLEQREIDEYLVSIFE